MLPAFHLYKQVDPFILKGGKYLLFYILELFGVFLLYDRNQQGLKTTRNLQEVCCPMQRCTPWEGRPADLTAQLSYRTDTVEEEAQRGTCRGNRQLLQWGKSHCFCACSPQPPDITSLQLTSSCQWWTRNQVSKGLCQVFSQAMLYSLLSPDSGKSRCRQLGALWWVSGRRGKDAEL